MDHRRKEGPTQRQSDNFGAKNFLPGGHHLQPQHRSQTHLQGNYASNQNDSLSLFVCPIEKGSTSLIDAIFIIKRDEIDLIHPRGGRDVVSYSRGTSCEDSNSISAAADAAVRNSRYETAM